MSATCTCSTCNESIVLISGGQDFYGYEMIITMTRHIFCQKHPFLVHIRSYMYNVLSMVADFSLSLFNGTVPIATTCEEGQY